MNILIFALLSFTLISSCEDTPSSNTQSFAQNQTDTCNDPDAPINCCFTNMPSALTSTMNIAGKEEPGDKLHISGTIFKQDGKTPYADVIMYAYHTDSKGYYSKKGNETGIQRWHGYLHGWCKTDKNGHYEIVSIRPAPYPNGSIPAHIHAAIKEPGNSEPYYINDFVFRDDPFVNEKYVSSLSLAGGTGIVDVKKSSEGVWIGQRDIVLIK